MDTLYSLLFLAVIAFTHARGPPRITQLVNRQQIVKEGQLLKLTCPVESDPQPIMEWVKDEELVTTAWVRYRLSSKSLKVKDVTPEDAGVYRCTATNGFGSATYDFRVWVMPDNNDTNWTPPPQDYEDYDVGLGEAPTFTKPDQMRPSSLMRPAGSSIRLRCRSVGKPKPAIVWFKDNLPISPETPAELEAEWGSEDDDEEENIAESRWTLRLRNLQREDSGRYTCKVFNTAGAINFTYTIEVIDRLSPPIVSEPSPINSTVEYGASTSFQCQVHSDVQPTIQWLKRVEHGSTHHQNATITVQGQQFIVLKTGKVWLRKDGSYLNKLTISHVTQQHAGMYVCLGANSMGFNFKSAHLTVIASPQDSPVREPVLSLPVIIAIPAAVLVILIIVTIVIVVRRQRQQKQKKLIRTRVPPPPTSPQNEKLHNDQNYSALQAYHVVQNAPSHERIIKNYSDFNSDASQHTPPHMHHQHHSPYGHQMMNGMNGMNGHGHMNGHAPVHHGPVPVAPPQVPVMHNMPPIQPPPPIQTFPYHSHTNHLHYAPC